MSVPYGKTIKLYIDGGSHDEKITMRLSGMPAGISVSAGELDAFLSRRRASSFEFATARKESDIPVFLTGLTDGKTDGTEINCVVFNENANSEDYSFNNTVPRPSHADYAAVMKYGSSADLRGGGHFSGRLTVLLCVAGFICKKYLEQYGITVSAHIKSIGGVNDDSFSYTENTLPRFENAFRTISEDAGKEMLKKIAEAKKNGDSLGGSVECKITGLKAGTGEHMFMGLENEISSALFAIPAVKAVSFGKGVEAATEKGSSFNDGYYFDGNGEVKTETNNSGGITGGMSTGMPVVFTAFIKPVPSVSVPLRSVNLKTKENVIIETGGRHDPCIVPRAVVCAEAAAAIALTDVLLTEEKPADDLEMLRREIDGTDRQLAALLGRRMILTDRIGKLKMEKNLPVSVPGREAAVYEKIRALSDDDKKDDTAEIYGKIIEISKKRQKKQ